MVLALLLALAAGSVQEAAPAAEGDVITIRTNCAITLCTDRDPATVWDFPSCTDFDLDEALIDSATHGDRSAIELLRGRFDRAATYAEKHRIAAALLRQVPNDTVYWNELFGHARNSVRFTTDGEYSEEYRKWCAERGYEPEAYDLVSHAALYIIAEDRRSRALLLQALDRGSLANLAVEGFAKQHDLTALPAIERVLERGGENRSAIAFGLIDFESEQADELALRYLTGDDRALYTELRAEESEEEPEE